MAETELRVRDMYDGIDPIELKNMNERERNVHIDQTLRNNPEILFKVYQQGRLHMVFFGTTRPGLWMRVLHDRITINLSFQMTRKRAEAEMYKITMSGSQEQLQHICDDFNEIYDEVMNILKDEGTAAGNNPEDDVEELRARIRELELENRMLRRN
ncbi:hypothetical protein QTP70_003763 [Hemibagrus guttatus]|uniref:Uncharacterized protein n=1 Tax=Hemibagrus guttatus TaxID=175788 RepID=A0AAE0RA62_9TELE|nr:hypothetical protein QTP86_003131 [Hemibagrus guttatus]KAK3548048.1 hypothetical protein QTP70_003763 [Hemibagrus guttatus]